MWASSEDHQTCNSNIITPKTIKRCDAIEEESDSESSSLIPLTNEVGQNNILKNSNNLNV